MQGLAESLAERRRAGLHRQAEALEGPAGVRMSSQGEPLRVFCSNDYLGLAADPRVAEALTEAVSRYGVGSGAAHLVTGHRDVHEALEADLAEFLGRERALLFSTGYMANLGVMQALVAAGEAVFQDRLNHASLLDGARLAGARLQRYRHADAGHLAQRLAASRHTPRLIATDGVFSMDGDLAPLHELAGLARRHGAWLLVDDAHGLGVLGPQGRGSAAAAGLGAADCPLLVGTLGKALGTFGAFVAGDAEVIDTLVQHARTYIYTTAPPPALAAATRAALAIARAEDWRRQHLARLVTRFRDGARRLGLDLMDSPSAIQPLRVGDSEAALAASSALRRRGLLVTAIRPPTVPAGSARLRVTLSAAHSESDVDELLAGLESLELARGAS